MELAYAAATDVGLVRRRNEDAYVAEQDLGLFVVVDGMGGHVAGEVASRTVADGVAEFIRATARDPDKTWPFETDPQLSDPANRLQVAIRSANRKLADLVSEDNTLNGTGATISAALFAHDRLVVSNVGDCRAYLVRDNGAWQITRDHSLVAEQVELGLLNVDEARQHPMRHILTRAVAGHLDMAIDTWEIRVQSADRVLLCSDGVHSLISAEELSRIVCAQEQTLEAICQQLIEAAKRAGGTDNSTVIIVAVSGLPDSTTAA